MESRLQNPELRNNPEFLPNENANIFLPISFNIFFRCLKEMSLLKRFF